MRCHVNGRRHRQLVESQSKLERTVFVAHFTKSVSQLELRAVFESFGPISSIFISPIKPDQAPFALIEFTDSSAAKAAISSENICIAGRRVVVKQRTVKTNKTLTKTSNKAPENISLTGQTSTSTHQAENIATVSDNASETSVVETCETLASGQNAVSSDTSSVCCTRRCDVTAASDVINDLQSIVSVDNRGHGDNVGGATVTKTTDTAAAAASVSDDSQMAQQTLADVLSRCPTVDDQLLCVMELQQLTSVDYSQREHICVALQNLFATNFPGCIVRQFGSTANGLGVRGCDMDLFLDVNIDCQELVDAAVMKQIVNKVSRMLHRQRDVYSNILKLPRARCPVVKFTHTATQINCDISVNNHLALHNTQLIKFLCSADQRVRPLLFAVRHWAKTQQLTGSGAKLTNYSLTLLVIFYLQNVDPPVLPTIEFLSQLTAMKQTVSGWDCSFPSDPTLLHTDNVSTFTQLLVGFFQFYSKFSFSSDVICPRLGKLMSHIEFMSYAWTDDRTRSFKMQPMCLQDPFVLEHNTSANVNTKVRDELKRSMTQVAVYCSHSKFNDLQNGGGFTYLLRAVSLSAGTTATSPGPTSSQHPSLHTFSLTFDLSRLSSQSIYRSHSNVDTLRINWCKNVAALIHAALVELLGFECVTSMQPTRQLLRDIESQCSQQQQQDAAMPSTETDSLPLSAAVGGCPLGSFVTNDCSSSTSAAVESLDGVSHTRKRSKSAELNTDVDNSKRYKLNNSQFKGQSSSLSSAINNILVDNTESCVDLQTTNTKLYHSQNAEVSQNADLTQNTSVQRMYDMLFSARCSSTLRLWCHRNNIRHQLQSDYEDEYQLEAVITERLRTSLSATNTSPPTAATVGGVQFEVAVFTRPFDCNTVTAVFVPSQSTVKQFSCFYTFFKSLVMKLVTNRDKKTDTLCV